MEAIIYQILIPETTSYESFMVINSDMSKYTNPHLYIVYISFVCNV